MQIFGLDFTSSPRKQKPIACASCTLRENTLELHEILAFKNFGDFEAFLAHPAPWIAAFDFPFGLPRKLLQNLSWPQSWPDYVRHVSALGKAEYEACLLAYQRERMPGDKLHLREADRLAGACSPMMLYRVPVGKMFFQGAPRLLASGASVLPCSPNSSGRVLLEGYPSLVARHWSGRGSYKTDTRSLQTAGQASTRRRIVDGICSAGLEQLYALKLDLSPGLRDQLCEDASGDSLDALLCAIQAAWAASQPGQTYGIPPGCDAAEGWIVDPMLAGPEYVGKVK